MPCYKNMGRTAVWIAVAAVVALDSARAAAACEELVVGSAKVRERATVRIYGVAGAGLFVSHMHVNADGAPDA